MTAPITDLDTLQSLVGKLPGPRDLKVIDFLDEHALHWLAHSPFAFVAFADGNTVAITAAGGVRGFVNSDQPRHITLPLTLLDDPDAARIGAGFGSLFLVPGIDETLRINGRIDRIDGDSVGVAIRECYLHCAKAFMRSRFWQATDSAAGDSDDVAQRLASSRFMALSTSDQDGNTDLSPKGDPAGALLRLAEGAAWFPDRPGNRRIDSFRNILSQSRVAAIALVPGQSTVLHLSGLASVHTDPAMIAGFCVDDRSPKLVVRIDDPRLDLAASPALKRARLWPAAVAPEGLDAAEIFKAHIKLSRSGGFQATVARTAIAIPGVMRKGLDHDYKNNLY